jgi:DNA transposition AAA+ family ATPase
MSVHPDDPQIKAMQRVLAAMEQSQVRLLMVDDADSMNREHLEGLQVLVEKSGCTVLLICLPGLLAGINIPFQVAARVEDPSGTQSNEEDV